MRRIVVLTGAGISAESGLKTFRDSDGLWEGYNIEDVATPEARNFITSAVNRYWKPNPMPPIMRWRNWKRNMM
jgi:NAD-dependent SIR2 family protein deacetylase